MQQEIRSLETIRAVDTVLQTPRTNVYSRSRNLTEHELNSADTSLSAEQERQLVEDASVVLAEVNANLVFRIHEDTGRQMVQLVEKDTEKVIREIPPERMLDVLAGIWEWAGLIVDRKE